MEMFALHSYVWSPSSLASTTNPPVCVCNHIIPHSTVSGRERLGLLELAMLLTVQFGVDQPDLVVALRPVLTQLAQDPSVSAEERAEVSQLEAL